MWMHDDRPLSHGVSRGDSSVVSLTREDVIEFEHALALEFGRVLRFQSSSLYLPDSSVGATDLWDRLLRCEAVVLPEEARMLLPLCAHGGLLGVFVAKDVDENSLAVPENVLAYIAAAAVEKLLLFKQSVTDGVTGLFNRPYFMLCLQRDIDRLRTSTFTLGNGVTDDDTPPAQAKTFGAPALIVAEARYTGPHAQRLGVHGEEVKLSAFSRAFQQALQKAGLGDAFLGIVGPGRVAAIVQGKAGKRLDEILEAVLEYVNSQRVHDAAVDEDIPMEAYAGAAVFPADLDGRDSGLPVKVQAETLLRRAEKALSAAKNTGSSAFFRFSRLADEGGLILDVSPMDRITVSLGRETGVAEGGLYSVWSSEEGKDVVCRGEIVITRVGEESSDAEILHLADAGMPMRAGDGLRFMAAGNGCGFSTALEPARKDLVTDLYPYRDFLRIYPGLRQEAQAYSLVLVRMPAEEAGDDPESSVFTLAEHALAVFTEDLKDTLDGEIVGGRFGHLGTIWFLPSRDAERAAEGAKNLLDRLEETVGIHTFCGVASWPYLNFNKTAVLENCRKALQYAGLPAALGDASPWGRPRLGVFDSTALTISADGHFSRGDLYEAMEEYKSALLADPENSTAENSLGICLASIGRPEKAGVRFENVLERDPKNLMALYNLGRVLQRLGHADKAKASFEACLRIEPRHLFSFIRLGCMAMDEGRMQTADHYFDQAAAAPGGEGIINRYKARTAMALGKSAEAKEFLHLALLHDPKDAMSLHLLAKLYLEDGDDPQIAESLARKSVALSPERTVYWSVLAEALEAQGRSEEAREISLRSA